MRSSKRNKNQVIYDYIVDAIASQRFKVGDRLPTEGELVKQFKTSRPTIARALKSLQNEGVIERIAGSGTYVRRTDHMTGRTFGLLIPGLGETEIFEPICGQIAREALQHDHTLLWGNIGEESDSKNANARAEMACRTYINRGVAGIFLALEYPPDEDETSRHIMDLLEGTDIPIVLIDRDLVRYPERSRYDLVGIDNRRAGFQATEHLLSLGCPRVDFFATKIQGPAIALRMQGYQDALIHNGITPDPDWVHSGDPTDLDFVRQIKNTGAEAFVCMNDPMAVRLMNCVEEAGFRVPKDIRIVGIDDIKYASMMRSPLTTVHQPCRDIGTAAFQAMLSRIEHPEMSPRDILLKTRLVVRKSCGATLPEYIPASVT